MIVYIDESGNFAYPNRNRTKHSYSCVGALTIPSRYHGKILKSFSKIKRKWHLGNTEPKGRDLSENQISEIVTLLINCNANFHICMTDMAYNSKDQIDNRKKEQGKRLLMNITGNHHPNLVKQLKELDDRMQSLPDQLFIQMCVMTELVNYQLRDVIMHYSLHDPPELGNFQWVVDQKNKNITAYENMWFTLLSPFIQSRQFTGNAKYHIMFLNEGDYSYFDKKYCGKLSQWPEYLPARKSKDHDSSDIPIVYIDKIFRNSLVFEDSQDKPGLQLCDIVTNACRRAVMGNLQYSGWKDIGKLMFKVDKYVVDLVHFGDINKPIIQVEETLCVNVIKQLTKEAKPLL